MNLLFLSRLKSTPNVASLAHTPCRRPVNEQAVSPQYAASPCAFLLSLTSNTTPYALIVAHLEMLLFTREYFQSSGWVEDKVPPKAQDAALNFETARLSVRSGSAYWADGRGRTLLLLWRATVLSFCHSHSDLPSRQGWTVQQ